MRRIAQLLVALPGGIGIEDRALTVGPRVDDEVQAAGQLRDLVSELDFLVGPVEADARKIRGLFLGDTHSALSTAAASPAELASTDPPST